jgi:hypothetical protein
VSASRPIDPDRIGPGGLARLALLAGGGGALTDGALIGWVGPAALIGTPYSSEALAPVFLLAGAIAFAVALLPSPARAVRAVRRATPHLLPYAPAPANAGVFLLWVFSTVAIYQGCLDIFAGAHAGGGGTGVPDPARLQLLIGVASAVFAILPLYLAVALRRLIPMGRWADSSGGTDTYGAVVAAPPADLVGAAVRFPSPGPALRDRGAAIGIVSAIAALFVSIGIQLVEVGTDPVPPGLWLESQVALPIYAAALALAVLAVDQSVRGLEARFADRVRPLGEAPAPAPGAGFVQ